MKKNQNWQLELYFLIYAYVITLNSMNFFNLQSDINLYYKILYYYDFSFFSYYAYNLLNVLFSIIHITILGLFIFKQKLPSRDFLFLTFFCRLFFEINGHSFETKQLQSLHQNSPLFCYLTIAIVVIFNLPAYYYLTKITFSKKL